MRNYGEEIAYWYFRLNGFFLLNNFVIHRRGIERYPSDSDLLAIRPPFVYEEIGGNFEDWDDRLFQMLSINSFIGLYVEVKTGAYNEAELFSRNYVLYSVQRLGIIPNVDEIMAQLDTGPIANLDGNIQVAKILVANRPIRNLNNFFFLPLIHLEEFIEERVRRYPAAKYSDRLFFDSNYLQALIERIHRSNTPEQDQ